MPDLYMAQRDKKTEQGIAMDRVQNDIYVEWSGPYSYEEVINYGKADEDAKKPKCAVKPSDIGLYQIYGRHPLYGDNVLIYIGKTGGRFCDRLIDRWVILGNEDRENVQIYLGMIYHEKFEHKNKITEDIARAESLLIHFHRPANNSSNINSLKYFDENITVINTGNYRSLQKTVSTKGFTKELDIYMKIESFAKSFKAEVYDEEDGYGFWLDEELWFGVDYNLWDYHTVLVLESSNQTLLSKAIKHDSEDDWYYEPVYGSEEEIRDMLSKHHASLKK